MASIDRQRLQAAIDAELKRFIGAHRRSGELFERAKKSLLAGVPMNWMTRWAGAWPVFVREASGGRFTDVDGNEYLDLCLGDTGAMTGHAPPAAVEAIAAQARRGTTLMLPTEDSIWVGEEMATASPSVWRARSPAGPASWSSTGAITAPSTRRSSRYATGWPARATGTSAPRSIRR